MQRVIKKRRYIATNDVGKRTVDEVKRRKWGYGRTNGQHALCEWRHNSKENSDKKIIGEIGWKQHEY